MVAVGVLSINHHLPVAKAGCGRFYTRQVKRNFRQKARGRRTRGRFRPLACPVEQSYRHIGIWTEGALPPGLIRSGAHDVYSVHREEDADLC